LPAEEPEEATTVLTGADGNQERTAGAACETKEAGSSSPAEMQPVDGPEFTGREQKPAEPYRFKPGETVPKSGVYRVEHASHRLMHQATLLEGSQFPKCKVCGASVRFHLVRAVDNGRVLPFRCNAILEKVTGRKSAG
jgi:hypothetical protein